MSAVDVALVAAGLIAVIAGGFMLIRYPIEVAGALLIAAPLLLSTFQLGPLTLDNYVTIAGAVIGVAVLVSGRARPRPGIRRLIAYPVAIAIAIALVNAVNQIDFLSSVVRFLAVAVLILLAGISPDSLYFLRVVRFVVAIGAASVIVGQFTGIFIMYRDEGSGEYRTGGLMGHPNFAAYAMAFVLLYLILRVSMSPLVFVECAVLLVGILLTGSIGAALTAGGVWAVSLIFRPTVRGWALALVGVGAVASVGSIFVDRLSSIRSTGNADSLSWRQIQWTNLISRTEGDRTIGIGWQQSETVTGNGLGAHSAYVQSFVELGVLGSVVVAGGALIAFGWVVRSVVAGLLVLYAMVSSLTDPVMFYPSTLVALMVFLVRERASMLVGATDEVKDPVSQ